MELFNLLIGWQNVKKGREHQHCESVGQSSSAADAPGANPAELHSTQVISERGKLKSVQQLKDRKHRFFMPCNVRYLDQHVCRSTELSRSSNWKASKQILSRGQLALYGH